MKKKNSTNSTEIAGHTYDSSDYQKKDQLSSGLATTHEQFSDSYAEGEIGAIIDDNDGENRSIPRKGFEQD
ncbi:YozQ family protein [Bacillus sp. V3B]|uniref:YozQ family protein n=1 Tax=Bacillus sp. V3B TaxID=2804915 RepID=UPI00210CCFE9|nr:YozQ family protein [Bacillus sp. V3B]MCQ6274836.1 YozQ family protein [Bacillus sp. V3B]